MATQSTDDEKVLDATLKDNDALMEAWNKRKPVKVLPSLLGTWRFVEASHQKLKNTYNMRIHFEGETMYVRSVVNRGSYEACKCEWNKDTKQGVLHFRSMTWTQAGALGGEAPIAEALLELPMWMTWSIEKDVLQLTDASNANRRWRFTSREESSVSWWKRFTCC
jgi:hypothetical protein